MRIAAARVTLKQHRFEVAAAAACGVIAALIGASIVFQISALGVSADCLNSVVRQGPAPEEPGCFSLVQEGSRILGETFLTGEGTLAVSVMGVVPFLVGLLGGVPIIAREMEARTAQTAWSLYGSRLRWLWRQVLPIAIILGAVVSLAALAAMPVADASVAWGRSGFSLIGLHGPLAIARAFAAFGLGLGVGALLGRTLPAFVVAGALCVSLLAGVGIARDWWISSREATVIVETGQSGEPDIAPGVITTGWGVITPEGTLLTSAEGRERATAAGVPPASEDDIQDIRALEWYAANGYTLVPVGIPDEVALGWAPYDGMLFGAAGILGIAASAVLVLRARPR